MRIVGGEFRGRRLAGPKGEAARPTSDKVREALFSILGDVEGLRMLDLFAGTGAVALEALSRGADRAVAVERDRKMLSVIRANAETVLGADAGRLEVVTGDALKQLAAGHLGRFDLVFIDPPYRDAERLGPQLTELLPSVLTGAATVVTESDRRTALDLSGSGLAQVSEHRYGDTLLRTLKSDE
jgi:16S rRNA (guanine966-N2)-methyltransferase